MAQQLFRDTKENYQSKSLTSVMNIQPGWMPVVFSGGGIMEVFKDSSLFSNVFSKSLKLNFFLEYKKTKC